MRNYGINDVSKHVNIASVNVAACHYLRPAFTHVTPALIGTQLAEAIKTSALRGFLKPMFLL